MRCIQFCRICQHWDFPCFSFCYQKKKIFFLYNHIVNGGYIKGLLLALGHFLFFFFIQFLGHSRHLESSQSAIVIGRIDSGALGETKNSLHSEKRASCNWSCGNRLQFPKKFAKTQLPLPPPPTKLNSPFHFWQLLCFAPFGCSLIFGFFGLLTRLKFQVLRCWGASEPYSNW